VLGGDFFSLSLSLLGLTSSTSALDLKPLFLVGGSSSLSAAFDRNPFFLFTTFSSGDSSGSA